MALYVKFDCATCENENCTGHGLPKTEKVCDGYKHTTTNADRFRSMSDEELAEYFRTHVSMCPDLEDNETMCKGANFMSNEVMCQKCWLGWLREEAKECPETI